MQTHDNSDANRQFQDLVRKAHEMSESGENTLTAGKPGERERTETVGRFQITQRPDDRACLRISIGRVNEDIARAGRMGDCDSYLVFRGDQGDIRNLLQSALIALNTSRQFRKV